MADYKDIKYVVNNATVQTAIDTLKGSAPTGLDTLEEIATSLNNDTTFNTTMTDAMALKANASALPSNVSDLTNDTGFITSSSLPSNVSDLTNDSGFLTSSSSLNSSNLSGSLPAVDGSALTGMSSGGVSATTAQASSVSLSGSGHGNNQSTTRTISCPAGNGLIVLKWKLTRGVGGGGNSGGGNLSWSLPSGTSITTLSRRADTDDTIQFSSGGFGHGYSVQSGNNHAMAQNGGVPFTLIGAYSSTSGGTITFNYNWSQNGNSQNPYATWDVVDATFLV